MCVCVYACMHLYAREREGERGTHAQRASKLGPVERWWTQDGTGVRKTETFIVFYLFVLHFVTCLKTCNFTVCFMSLRTSISVFYHNTARDIVTVLLIFAKYLSLYHTVSHAHTRTHKHTCIISTQEEWRQPGTGAWSGGAEAGVL